MHVTYTVLPQTLYHHIHCITAYIVSPHTLDHYIHCITAYTSIAAYIVYTDICKHCKPTQQDPKQVSPTGTALRGSVCGRECGEGRQFGAGRELWLGFPEGTRSLAMGRCGNCFPSPGLSFPIWIIRELGYGMPKAPNRLRQSGFTALWLAEAHTCLFSQSELKMQVPGCHPEIMLPQARWGPGVCTTACPLCG